MATNIVYSQSLEINLCDDNGDGYSNFNIEEIEDYVLQTIGEENDSFQEQILISTSEGNILRLDSPSSNPSITPLCNYVYSITDIAVDLNKEITICSNNFIKVDSDCNFDPYPYDAFQVNSLSFDNLGYLYYGYANESYIRRIEIINDIFYGETWHDFQIGTSAGDFVLLDDKMYIAWRLSSNNYRLYEVIIDDANNYVSHVDLGQIPNKTFGLASELGVLYGITIDKLYKIDLNSFTFTDIISNVNPEDKWYGAAGLHEAIIYTTSTHMSLDDAQNNINAINGDWTNTIIGGQIIYVRIENSLTNEVNIFPVNINILTYPNVNQPVDLEMCYDNTYNIFDLTQVSSQMQINNNDNLVFTYYNLDPEINPTATPVSIQYQSTENIETLFVSVEKNNNGCNLIYTFQIINNDTPNLLPLSDIESPTLLEDCYFNENNTGFFNLTDIENHIILDNGNFEISYYLNYLDAETSNNQIPHLYYLQEQIQEIFIKVIDEKGCFTISNFYLTLDCFINNESLINIVFPKFITPNGDGFNDFWNIKGVSEKTRRESTVTIFNRYGKVLYTFKPYYNIGWDGTYNGILLPSTDYWFLFTTSSGIKKTGHFTLKR